MGGVAGSSQERDTHSRRGWVHTGLPRLSAACCALPTRAPATAGAGVVCDSSRVRGPSPGRAVSSHREDELGQGGPSSRSGAFCRSGSTADPTGQKVGQSQPRVGHACGPSNALPSEDLDRRRNSEFGQGRRERPQQLWPSGASRPQELWGGALSCPLGAQGSGSPCCGRWAHPAYLGSP